jgi:thiamine biosynthesis lipoprotein
VPGGVDPSGYVKGWAADVVADRLVKQGFENVSINAAGDLSCRGLQEPDQPWVVGIRSPFDDQAIIGSSEVFNTSMATSGEYERGKHIFNPFTNDRKLNLVSASVIGPDGGLADALATALLIVGLDGVQWFKEFPGWSGFLIDPDTVHTFGPAFAGLDASL